MAFSQILINEMFKKIFYFFAYILPDYMAHDITKEFEKIDHFENITPLTANIYTIHKSQKAKKSPKKPKKPKSCLPCVATTPLTASTYTRAKRSKCSLRTPWVWCFRPKSVRYSIQMSRHSRLGMTLVSTSVRNQQPCFVFFKDASPWLPSNFRRDTFDSYVTKYLRMDLLDLITKGKIMALDK